MSPTRALPQPSELTEEFWAAAARHELVRPVCRECGESFFTPQVCCPRCLSEDWAYEESSGRGTVYSVTAVHRAPLEGFEPPYRVAIVDLEEGWQMLSNIIGEEPVEIDDEVVVAWQQVDGFTLPAFTKEAAA